MDEKQKPEPKIDVTLIVLGFIAFILLDIVSLIPGVGDLADVPYAISFIIAFIFGDFGAMIMGTFVVVGILKAIPIAQELPWFTIGWIITIWVDQHPSSKLAQAEKLAVALESGKGVPGAGVAVEIYAAEKGVEGAERAAAEAKTGMKGIEAGGVAEAEAGAVAKELAGPGTGHLGQEEFGLEEAEEPTERLKREIFEKSPKQKEESEEEEVSGEKKEATEEAPVLREYTETERAQEEMAELFKNPNIVDLRTEQAEPEKNDTIKRSDQSTPEKAA